MWNTCNHWELVMHLMSFIRLAWKLFPHVCLCQILISFYSHTCELWTLRLLDWSVWNVSLILSSYEPYFLISLVGINFISFDHTHTYVPYPVPMPLSCTPARLELLIINNRITYRAITLIIFSFQLQHNICHTTAEERVCASAQLGLNVTKKGQGSNKNLEDLEFDGPCALVCLSF